MTYFPPQSGPCVICGDTNYGLSCGGPTICPKCDCGHFDAATVDKQARAMATMRLELANFRVLLDGLFHSMPLTPEMPEHVKDYLTNLSSLVYIDGKEGVIRAREVVNGHVGTPPERGNG